MSDQRDAILAAACDLYLLSGLDGFSMRKLARDVGVTAPALYRHYDGREAVLADVVREAHRAFLSYIYRALEGSTPLDRFRRAGEGYLDFALEHPRWYTIMFSGPERLGMDALPEDIEAQGCAIHQFWIDRVSECMRAGILIEGDPLDVSLTMWAHAHGMVQLFHQGRLGTEDPHEFRALFAASGARLMAGVATDAWADGLAAQAKAEPVQDVHLGTATTGA
ncbi:MAG TPA: TetR/AcrR family transcriptional regulator [Longimicrobiales bacterium]|nr:TetR/AcrR family transcriptional regulator [Longimicrobiales bacterium]